jgi:hypothetical protein
VHLCLEAIVICDILDSPHVAVWLLKRVMTHHGIAVTRFLLRVGISSSGVGDAVSILVTWIGLQNNLEEG